MTPPTIKKCPTCLQFQDFVPSIPSDKTYLSTAQNAVVTCPDGTTATVPIPAGIVGYELKFTVGNPPYPNLTLNCTGGLISIPVPDNVTQSDLDALVNQLLNTCASQIAESIGCSAGTFFNTQQIYNGCQFGYFPIISGALPPGVVVFPIGSTGLSAESFAVLAGTILSTISVADANAKAQQVLREIFSTGNAGCQCG